MSDFFRPPHPGWIGFIGFGLYLLTAATFAPKQIPTFLGPFHWLGTYMGEQLPTLTFALFVATVIIHIGETVYTAKLCSQKRLNTVATVKWCLSTLIFGFASFTRLQPYQPRND